MGSVEQERRGRINLRVDPDQEVRLRAAAAVVVDAIDEQPAEFYRHFDFHNLDDRRLWRRLSDIAAALGE